MKEKSERRKGIENYASHWVLVLSGSLLVLSVTFNNIGIGKIIDAYSQKMISDIKHSEANRFPPLQCTNWSLEIEEIADRVTLLESDSHKSGS